MVELAEEIRRFLVTEVSKTGGHLGPNLGVVELTLGIHRVFDSPRDAIVWDTGHQSYVHKLVTGRFARFGTIRTRGGLMGYPNPDESPYDLFMTGHAGCSVSTAMGLRSDFRRAERDMRSGTRPPVRPGARRWARGVPRATCSGRRTTGTGRAILAPAIPWPG